MILSIGYGNHLTHDALAAAIDTYSVDVLMDVRSFPSSRRAQFRQAALEARFGGAYHWAGDTLGGRDVIADGAIAALAELSATTTVLLMCAEADPARCHRETEIARRLRPLGIEVKHLLPLP